jgi:hypothetical protein
MNLEERYQNLAAKPLRLVSLDLESKAEALVIRQDYESACAKYREAYEQQKQINETFPLSLSYNLGRATRLQRQAIYCMAEPLLQRSLTLRERSRPSHRSQGVGTSRRASTTSVEFAG